ncbi:NAD-dependent epimerase/dehydratase family protein [Paracoccus onubensis]|uniref:NAD-dependent epimerase/dehydratase family protein n=1 Tax=Paracoccus onubensis TaxID=1675788 RepID=UPI002731FA4B|nr:NAD-dependent epimerase/dehydratase family protein [Paracoccus onubensis]MDP0927750.1 NAD-dependent epimerase/dehydratase family protein [Paracoccus onubensis]
MRVLLTGGTGMLGRAMRRIQPQHAPAIRLYTPTRDELPLTDRSAVVSWLNMNPVDAVIHAAARVGGIQANMNDPVGYLSENLRINDAVIMGAYEAGVERLIFLGSSCMYPKDYRQPLVEQDILAAPLEPTNEGYALSKIAAARLCDYVSRQYPTRAFRTLVPCNLFGIEDHFCSIASHLIAAIVTKVIDARDDGHSEVEIWGSGNARREFLFVDDFARFIMDILPRLETLPDLLNIGMDRDHSVTEYYRMIAQIAGWQGRFTHDLTRPEGMMAKLMSSSRAREYGWAPPKDLASALRLTIAAYEQQKASGV